MEAGEGVREGEVYRWGWRAGGQIVCDSPVVSHYVTLVVVSSVYFKFQVLI